MIPYTPTQINNILYQVKDIDELKVLVDYLHDNEYYYHNYLPDWIEDIRLLLIMFKTQ